MHARLKVGHILFAMETFSIAELDVCRCFWPELFDASASQSERCGSWRCDLHYIELERGAAAVDDENVHAVDSARTLQRQFRISGGSMLVART